MSALTDLDRDRLVAMVEWMAEELSEWIASESVESGHGDAKCRTPGELIGDAIAATQREDNHKWVIWYELSRVGVWPCKSREDAFATAWFLEEDSDSNDYGDCYTLLGIENPLGEFIDLAEYYSVKPEIEQRRRAAHQAEAAIEAARPQFKITVTGPDGHNLIETWSDQFIDKYRTKFIAQFGPDRVTVEQIKGENNGQ